MNQSEFILKFKNEYAERSFNQNETLQWLHKNKVMSMSWGYHKPTKIADTGLIFKVNGHHHQGWVLITLSWDDTYTVRFLSLEFEEKLPEQNTVYCDELQERIDNVVEKIKDYFN